MSNLQLQTEENCDISLSQIENMLDQSEIEPQTKCKNIETKYCINSTVISISNQIKLLGDDFSEFNIPSHYLPPNIQVGNVFQVTFQRNRSEENKLKNQIEQIQKSALNDQ
ncbi:unnamed protein product [Paramecium primaurelia]|uniref:Uncharacterized protein n=1 Tax=Paramecium primaurelia TaxID=5886 RepID=A0A8S1JTQ8_PARPR|nr:unnamed protein product [Paramecium primaurelia]